MKDKLKILSILLIVLVFFWHIGAIDPSDLDVFGNLALPIILTCATVFFVKKDTINLWWYFSLIFWLCVALLIFTGEEGTGLDVGIGDGKIIATGFLSWIYLLLSLAIIAVKSWKLRGK